MSQHINQEKAVAIASRYVTNGFHKSEALIYVGYSPAYAKTSAASRVFSNPVVKAEVDKIMTRNAEIVDVEVSEIIRGLRLKAFPSGDSPVRDSDNIRALELLGKYLVMFGEQSTTVEKVEAKALTEVQVKEAKEYARWRLLQGGSS